MCKTLKKKNQRKCNLKFVRYIVYNIYTITYNDTLINESDEINSIFNVTLVDKYCTFVCESDTQRLRICMCISQILTRKLKSLYLILKIVNEIEKYGE